MLTLDDLEKRYSVVYLPSEGKFYSNKCSKVKLFHIDGSDISVLTDPNLAANGDTISTLLARKVAKADDTDAFVKVEDMVIGDRVTLLIMLRIQMNHIYQFPLIDPKTNEVFYHDFDLTTLKTKDVIQPHSDRTFQFMFKKSYKKDDKYQPIEVRFRLLTGIDERLLRPYEKGSQNNYLIEKLTLITTEVGGNKDKNFIKKFLEISNLDELLEYNKFTSDVMPGLDLNLEIPSPGGAIVKTYFPFTANFFIPRIS